MRLPSMVWYGHVTETVAWHQYILYYYVNIHVVEYGLRLRVICAMKSAV